MTKGELRKLRKVNRAAGGTIEIAPDGTLEMVAPRSRRTEYEHQCRMDRWARRNYDTEGAADTE